MEGVDEKMLRRRLYVIKGKLDWSGNESPKNERCNGGSNCAREWKVRLSERSSDVAKKGGK